VARFSILSFTAALIILGCSGSGDGSSGNMEDIIETTFPKTTNSGRILSIDDLKTAGFKSRKQYKKVELLPPLTEAWHGMFKKMDYEIRFYSSHEDASGQGVVDAEIVTGKDGIVTGDVPWEDGARDRRRCSRPPGQPHSGCNYTSKYGDFVIYENVIAMCEGKDKLESRETCFNLLSLLFTP